MSSTAPPSAYPHNDYHHYTNVADGAQYAAVPHDLHLDHSESPLDSLVRKTSMRRNAQASSSSNDPSRQQLIHEQRLGQQSHQGQLVQSAPDTDDDSDFYDSAYDAYYDPSPSIPQIRTTSPGPSPSNNANHGIQIHVASPPLSTQDAGLPSPLLHSTFERDSMATTYSRNTTSSYTFQSGPQSRLSNQSTTPSQYADSLSAYRYFGASGNDDAASVYSQSTAQGFDPALRDSWQSTTPAQRQGNPVQPESLHDPPASIPSVIVSSPNQVRNIRFEASPALSPSQGSAPVLKPVAFNYSRPVRTQAAGIPVQEERVTPQLHPDMMQQKMAVLERRGKMGTPSLRADMSRPSLDHDTLQLNSSNGRSASPVSVYSDYSYYPYGSAAPSPTTPTGLRPSSADPPADLRRTRSTPAMMPESKQGNGVMTPEDYLSLGIQHHEADRMQESVRCFERSANEGGGCGGGMLMYGLALRHGWGCAKNENLGFRWLRKAAESVVGDLEKVRTGGSGTEIGAMKKELPLAIYEVGHCFFHGWGVPKDQKMGFSYYAAAARLGDGDAQMTLADCLEKGKGCKKDKKEAAKWYREAIKQGQSDVGLAWIYKDKYQ